MTRVLKKVGVNFFCRRASSQYFSIERVFQQIQFGLSPRFEATTVFCPFDSIGIFRRTANVLNVLPKQGDINHVTGDTHYLAIALNSSRTILTIHDCIMMHRLNGMAKGIYRFFWLWLPIKKASVVTVVSQAIADELIRYVPGCSHKIQVISNPLSSEFRYVRKSFSKLAPRVLFVGTSENKNLERAVRSLHGLRCVLVIVGSLSDHQLELLNSMGLCWEHFEGLDCQQILEQYILADLLLFPTLYEGFGLPIIEAQAVGRPVVTSLLEPMIDVSGGASSFVDPMSIESIRSGVLRIIEDDDFRTELIEKGLQNVKRFASEIIVREYEDLYDRLVEQRKARFW